MTSPKPITLTSGANPNPSLAPEPLIIVGGMPAGEVTSTDITDATDTGRSVLTAATQAAARTAIGAGTGTSNLAVATTAPAALAATAAVGTGTTAARADHVHVFPTAAQVGAAATSHTQAATTVTVAASAGIVGANAQLVLADLAARVLALEAAQA